MPLALGAQIEKPKPCSASTLITDNIAMEASGRSAPLKIRPSVVKKAPLKQWTQKLVGLHFQNVQGQH